VSSAIRKKSAKMSRDPYLDDVRLRDAHLYLFIDIYLLVLQSPPRDLPRTVSNVFLSFDLSVPSLSTRTSRSGAESAGECSCEIRLSVSFFYRYRGHT